jgi:adenosylhomocysteine nucleosidase
MPRCGQHDRSQASYQQLKPRQRIGIVAAMEREVWPLVRHWNATEREFDGRQFRFFENERAVLVCGGMGAEAARWASEAMIQLYHPAALESVGFAGALDPRLEVGTLLGVKRVIDSRDGSKADAAVGYWTLLTVESISGAAEKAKLAAAYDADAVDMEAAAVARAAQAHGLPFLALKAVSDGYDFDVPSFERFLGSRGDFRSARFLAFAAVRPWLWARLWRLARNCAKARNALCGWLEQYNHPAEKGENHRTEFDARPVIR